MATRDNGRGTLVLDKQVRGVGRIKKASGTNDARTFKRIVGMVDALADRGRLDLLAALRDGVVTPLQLLDAFRREDLDRLPSAETIVPLWTAEGADDAGAVALWLKAWKKSDDHKRTTASTFAQLRKLTTGNPPTATVGELPALLKQYRAVCEKAGHATSFNRARSHVQAFLRERLGRGHHLYKQVQEADRAKESDAEDVGHPFTSVADFEAFAAALAAKAPEHATIARTMVTTGMHAKELWAARPFKVEPLAVYVLGTKREGRRRKVPLVAAPAIPQRHRRTFEDRVRDVTGAVRTVYDLRRTYAHWMEMAGVPRARRKLYLGHRSGDVTDLYERHEVEAYLAHDAALLTTYLTRGGWTGPLATSTVSER